VHIGWVLHPIPNKPYTLLRVSRGPKETTLPFRSPNSWKVGTRVRAGIRISSKFPNQLATRVCAHLTRWRAALWLVTTERKGFCVLRFVTRRSNGSLAYPCLPSPPAPRLPFHTGTSSLLTQCRKARDDGRHKEQEGEKQRERTRERERVERREIAELWE
jgi:hypothetical protein